MGKHWIQSIIYRLKSKNMLKSSKKNVAGSEMSNGMNHIAQGTKVIGDIISKGNFRLDGELEGNLVSESRVVLGESSVLSGSLKSQNAEVAGKVKGIVEVTDELVLRSTADLQADITTGSLNIESGAMFNGVTKMGAVVKGLGEDGSRKEKRA